MWSASMHKPFHYRAPVVDGLVDSRTPARAAVVNRFGFSFQVAEPDGSTANFAASLTKVAKESASIFCMMCARWI